MIKSRLPECASYISEKIKNCQLKGLISENAKIVKKGDIISGKIIKITSEQLYIDVKAKTYGILSIKEFEHDQEMPEVGDIIDVYVKNIQVKNDLQIPMLSKELAMRNALWNDLEEAYRESKTIKGNIVGYSPINKVFDIYVSGILMKLQANHMDISTMKNPKDFIGKNEEFLILKILEPDNIASKIFLSRKQICLNNLHSDNQLGINENKVFQGKVIKIHENGAEIVFSLANKQSIKGWLSYNNSNNDSELKVGNTCEVSVLKVENAKVYLTQEYAYLESIKQYLLPDVVVYGKVVKITEFGIFIHLPDKFGKINKNIQGLIHLSETCSIRTKILGEVFKQNQIIEVRTKVTQKSTEEKKRISLTIRDTESDPWRALNINVGDKLNCEVRDITPYNRAFVKISDILDGLIRYNQHSAWRMPKVGDITPVTVFEFNPLENKAVLIEGHYDLDQIKQIIKDAEKNKFISGIIKNINALEKSVEVSII